MLNDKHRGMSNTRIYKIWCGMKQRCENPNSDSYKWYGAKGVKVLWTSFEEFAEDMYTSYLEHALLYGETDTTIDRIDPYKDYCKENCKWATKEEQAKNKRERDKKINSTIKAIRDGYSTVDMVSELLKVNTKQLQNIIDPNRNHRKILDKIGCIKEGNNYLFNEEGIKYIAYQYMNKNDECFDYVYKSNKPLNTFVNKVEIENNNLKLNVNKKKINMNTLKKSN